MGSSGFDPWDENGVVPNPPDHDAGSSNAVDLKDLRPYRVRLSLTWEYLVLARSHAEAMSIETAVEARNSEVEPETREWKIEADETTLEILPRDWDEGCLIYGPLDGVSVEEVRNALAEREAADLQVGVRVYDRRMDLFGTIEKIRIAEGQARSNAMATVKYEWPMSPDAEPREVRLSELIAAHKVERG